MLKLNSLIAELLGAHTGDGTLYKTKWGLVWELRGGLNEKEYYLNSVTPLLKKIFGIEFNSKFRSGGANGCWGIQTSKKQIIDLLLEFGFKSGTKTYTALVPDIILNSDVQIKRSFVRGLFDTDGCSRFDKINKNIFYTYPRIEFGFASKHLRDTLKLLLDNLDFRSFVWQDKTAFRICVSGKIMLNKWMNEISPNNPKHLKKYSFWKKEGYYKHI